MKYLQTSRYSQWQKPVRYVALLLAALLLCAPSTALADSAIVTNLSPTGLPLAGGQVTVEGSNFTNIKQVASNFNHSLALTHDGRVFAWGDNAQGQLGDGSTSDSLTPAQVSTGGAMAGKTIIGVAAGAFHSLAFASDGTVLAWGDNLYGQLGDGSGTDSSVPVAVDLTGNVVQVAASAWTSYALLDDGTVYSWGRGDIGQLGDGTTGNAPSPVLVTLSGALAGEKVVQLAGAPASDFVAVLTEDGTVHAWGDNSQGQLGTGSAGGTANTPAAAAAGAIAGKQITQIAAGAYHIVAVDTDGSVYSWGDNERGQLGDGTHDDRTSPIAVTTGGVVDGKVTISVAASAFASYAVTNDSSTYSWGWNDLGQLGRDTTPFPEVEVPGALPTSGLRQLSGGYKYALALADDGRVFAWGDNAQGQLGDGSLTSVTEPFAVTGELAPFYDVPTVLVGDAPATNVVVASDGQLTFMAPSHEAGTYNVVVTFADGRTQVLGAVTYSGDIVVPGGIIPSAPATGFPQAKAFWTLLSLAFFGLAGVLVAAARHLMRRS